MYRLITGQVILSKDEREEIEKFLDKAYQSLRFGALSLSQTRQWELSQTAGSLLYRFTKKETH